MGNSFGCDLGRHLQKVGVLWRNYQVGDMMRPLMRMNTSIGELVVRGHDLWSRRQKLRGGCGVLNMLMAPWVVLLMVVLLVVANLVVQMRVQASLSRLGRNHRVE